MRSPGGDNNLAVILSTYEPNIRCGRVETFGDAPSCGTILAEMPASTGDLRFGPDDIPGVQEPLPQLFTGGKLILRYCVLYPSNRDCIGDHSCLLRLFSATGRADSTSWYSIWEAAEATFARCARDRKSGSFRGLGRIFAHRKILQIG